MMKNDSGDESKLYPIRETFQVDKAYAGFVIGRDGVLSTGWKGKLEQS